MHKRSVAVFILYLVSMALAVGRIATISGDSRILAAQDQGTIALTVDRPRGVIYDCYLRPLTGAEIEYMAVLTPTEAVRKEIERCFQEEARREDLKKRLNQGMPFTALVPSDFSAEGAYIFAVQKRYSHDQIAAHIIGYIDRSSNKGITGVELGYEKVLNKIEPVSIRFAKNAMGHIYDGVQPVITRSDGDKAGVALTIDSRIQGVAEEAAKSTFERGAIVVMECETGKIRAMVSLPSYSPDDVAAALDQPLSPLINRAITPYNVGSVYKLCVAAAALENGYGDFVHTCSSSVTLGVNTFRCAGGRAHGVIDLEQALEVSCNTYFIMLGQKLGAEKIYNMSRLFGFGQPQSLGGGIFSKEGSLPDLSRLSTQPATLANISFGQGDLLLTPLNIACMTAAIAQNGKCPSPTLIEGEVSSEGQLVPDGYVTPAISVMNATTAATLRSFMINVVETGTGTKAKPELLGAGGKTGTAQTGWIENGKPVEQAWFCGFYPAQAPKYVIVAMAENGRSGGSTTAPIFKQIADALYEEIDR